MRPRISVQSTTSERTLVDADEVKTIPSKLLQLAGIIDGEGNHDLYLRFSEFSALWQEWKMKGCTGFVKKVKYFRVHSTLCSRS